MKVERNKVTGKRLFSYTGCLDKEITRCEKKLSFLLTENQYYKRKFEEAAEEYKKNLIQIDDIEAFLSNVKSEPSEVKT